MSNDPIKAALAEAKMPIAAGNCRDPETCTEDTGAPCYCESRAAEIVAAFLNAQPPTAATIRLYLGEVSAQGMRDIYAYHRWLAAMAKKEAARDA